MEIRAKLKDNLELLRPKLGIDSSFDMLLREFAIGGRDVALIYLDGFINSESTARLMEHLMQLRREDILPDPIQKLVRSHLPFYEVAVITTLEEVVDEVLAGPAVLLVDGYQQAIVVDVRQYPARSIQEPDLERVTRGSRDGFVETALFNANLIRRRLRDPGLRFEAVRVGARSKTDVFIGYINDVVNQEILDELRQRIEKIQTVSLTMGAKTLEEYIAGNKINPFPTVRYTERPDVVAAHLLEGHIVVLIDTTPMAMLLPTTAWHFTQHAEEYFQNPVVGTYLRWIRFLAILVAYFTAPLWLLAAQSAEYLPPSLQFIGPSTVGNTPLFLQFVILEFTIDIIKMAFIHTPSPLASSLGIVATILLGEFAVKVGLFVPETILYQAISAIALFAIPNYEFALALRLFKLLMVVATGLFGVYGFIGGFAATLGVMALTRSLKMPYLWPLIPLDWNALKRLLFRYPIPDVSMRPSRMQTRDPDLQ